MAINIFDMQATVRNSFFSVEHCSHGSASQADAASCPDYLESTDASTIVGEDAATVMGSLAAKPYQSTGASPEDLDIAEDDAGLSAW